jgi:hypothetical protein
MPTIDDLFLRTGRFITEDWYKNLVDVLKGIEAKKGIWYGGYVSSDILPEIDLALNLGIGNLRWLNVFAGYGYFSYSVFAPNIVGGVGVSRCIIGFGEAGYIIYAGSYEEHQPFSQAKGSSEGMPVPFSGKAKKLKVRVHANSLDASTIVIVRKNETDTSLTVTIPSGSTGLFENNTVEVEYAEGDRIDFVIDATSSTSGEMDIAGISVCFEG